MPNDLGGELLPAQRTGLRKLLNKRAILAAGAVMIGCLAYAGLFAFPKRVNFTYGGTTCTGQLAVLPGLHRAVDASRFKLEFRGGMSAGGVKLASTQVCFVPAVAPVKGVVRVASAPFGAWIFRANYDLAVEEAPRLMDAAPPAQALSQPVELKLNQPDTVFKYSLAAENKEQTCSAKSVELVCGVDKLGLKQGTAYALKLQRSFEGKQTGQTAGVKVAILPATKVTGTSIKPDELIYAKPKNADITLDKALTAAEAKLEQVDGNKATPVNVHAKVAGAHVQLAWDEDLQREKTYRLTLTSAAASDGSTLDGAYALNFRTSGGPKVVGSTLGGMADGNARVVVTFDQALAKDANVAGLAGISGGGAKISRQGNNQVVFALQNVPRCAAFTLTIGKGLASEGGVASDAGWSQASRVNCRETRTIGYSVKGRPIQAYFYGSGATTVLFTGGIHGDEPSGTYIMQDWASYLDANAYKIPANKQVVIVPTINPDGIAANQRYNAHNVNIDRNFPSSDWVSDIQVLGGKVLPQGGGATPLSEPETRAIADLTSSLQLRTEVSFHSSGALVGANKVADSVTIGSLYAAGVGYTTMFYNPEQIMGYTLTGEYETWMGDHGIPAILIELPSSTGRYFSRHQDVLWRMVNL